MIYFIQAVDGGPIKIGWSNKPKKRKAVLQRKLGKPLQILCVIEGGRWDEYKLHKQFANFRLYGEWFNPDDSLLDFIARAKPVEITKKSTVCIKVKAKKERLSYAQMKSLPKQCNKCKEWKTGWDFKMQNGTCKDCAKRRKIRKD